MFSKYEYVYALYRERSFTKAAERLFISQPSLSVAVKNIEQKVGAPLFERSMSGITPTEVGREYIAAAEKIMNIEREFQNKIHDIYKLNTGEISVGGTNYLCSYVLPEIINRFTSLYPKIGVTLTEANSKTLNEMLRSETLDIIVDSFDEIPEGLTGEKLADEKILLCLPANRPLNQKLHGFSISPDDIYSNKIDISSVKTVPIEVFKDESFVLLKPENDMYGRAMKVFEHSGVTPKVIFSVDQLNISYALADSGMGACFATDTLFKYGKFHNNVTLYNIDNSGHRTLYVAHRRHQYRTNAMAEFIRIARQVILTKN